MADYAVTFHNFYSFVYVADHNFFQNQITELKSGQAPNPNALRSALLDPAVNIIFQKLKGELKTTKAKLEETQNELGAWKFTVDSNTGKRLMAKCRLLYQENEDLGKLTSNGRLAKLEGDLALHKSFCGELKKSQSEVELIIQDLDEEVEGLTSTIIILQQELITKNERIAQLEADLSKSREHEIKQEDISNDVEERKEEMKDDDDSMSEVQEVKIEQTTPETIEIAS